MAFPESQTQEADMNAKDLGALPIPFGPHAVGEALASARRLAGSIGRRARRAAGAVARAAVAHQSESTQQWISRLEPKAAF
jgi:hypothetical protein